jgi:hypothetical protein
MTRLLLRRLLARLIAKTPQFALAASYQSSSAHCGRHHLPEAVHPAWHEWLEHRDALTSILIGVALVAMPGHAAAWLERARALHKEGPRQPPMVAIATFRRWSELAATTWPWLQVLLLLPRRFPFFHSRRQTVVSPCNFEKALPVFRFLSVTRHYARLQRPVVPVLSLQKEFAINHSAILSSVGNLINAGAPGFQDVPMASQKTSRCLCLAACSSPLSSACPPPPLRSFRPGLAA